MSTYDFLEMINEAYQVLGDGERSKNLVLLPDIIVIIDPTRLHWKNVSEYLDVIRCTPEYFMSFLKHELPGKNINWFSSSFEDGIIIHGKKQKKTSITELARKFVENCIVCSTCKNPNTNMTKINSKYYEINCLDCGAMKTINF
jgi:translation initiation factor 2 beta subunit (eIF-2beta)/eIF-5